MLYYIVLYHILYYIIMNYFSNKSAEWNSSFSLQ